MSHTRLAMILAISVAIAPFALDTYLPAFPEMAAFLGVSVHEVALSVPVYMAALAAGQLIGGPLSDHHGRARIMFTGLVVFVLSSFLISQINTLNQLLILRVFQALGGGFIIVSVPALVRDRARGIEAAKLFSLIGLMTVAAPAVAPAAGSLLLRFGGWSSIFIFLGIYATLAAVVLKMTVFSGPQKAQSVVLEEQSFDFLKRYVAVLKTPSAIRYILLQASIFSVIMLFVTHASFIYQEHFGVSNGVFSALFGANLLLMWTIMLLNRWLLGFLAPAIILRAGVITQAIGVACLVLVTQVSPVLGLFVPAMMLSIGAVGATSPNCQACYMEHFAQNGGTAAALMGSMQFGLAALVSALSVLLPETIQTIVLVQAACSIVALILVCYPDKPRR